MNNAFYGMLTLTIFLGLTVVAFVLLSRASQVVSARVLAVTMGQRSVRPRRRIREELRQGVLAVASWMRILTGAPDNPKLAERFGRLGASGELYRDLYAATRLMGPLFGVMLGAFVSSNRVFAMISLGGILYLAPDIALQRMIKRRRERIRRSIPDAVDLLVICVDAGLGMDQAMLRVGVELGASHPEMYEEFLQISREQRAGKLRIEAWQSMAGRCQLQEMDAFVNMLMQTERFGTPIARALSNFGDGIRLKRRQHAEELAAKTTVKIIFPLVLFIFPSIFIVLLGPAGLTIARGLSGMGQ